MSDKPEETTRKRGRPCLCTPELTAEFGHYMAAGLYLDDVAGLCHIGRSTAYDWLAEGDAAIAAAGGDLAEVPEEVRHYADFSDTVRAAEAKALARNLALVQQGAQDRPEPVQRDEDGKVIGKLIPGDWRAAAEFLKMRKPDTWGNRKSTHEHSGPGGGPMQVNVGWFDAVEEWENQDAAGGETAGDGDGDAAETRDEEAAPE